MSDAMRAAIEKMRSGRIIRVYRDDPRCRIQTPGVVGEQETHIHKNTVHALLSRGVIRVVKHCPDCTTYVID